MDLSRWSGERIVLWAGGLLVVDLLFFPWHKLPPAVLLLGGIRPTRTGVQDPHALQGTLALLLAVAMVAQVLLARSSSEMANPALVRLQPVAGMATLAMLAWKLALATSYLSVGAYLGTLLAAALAYGGFTLGKGPGARGYR